MKIRDCFVPVDFVVLDMGVDKETPFILGQPFFSTTDAQINVGAGEIQLPINGRDEKFRFQPRCDSQCSMVKIRCELHGQNIREVEVMPPIKDSLITFMEKV